MPSGAGAAVVRSRKSAALLRLGRSFRGGGGFMWVAAVSGNDADHPPRAERSGNPADFFVLEMEDGRSGVDRSGARADLDLHTARAASAPRFAGGTECAPQGAAGTLGRPLDGAANATRLDQSLPGLHGSGNPRLGSEPRRHGRLSEGGSNR